MSSEDLDAGNHGFGSDVLKLLALLRLNSTENSTRTAAAATPTPFSSAARSKKRRSYSSSPYFRKSLSRRAKLHGSATVNRPLSFIPPSPPPLPDPSIAETSNVSDFSKPQFLKSQSPENPKNEDISLFTPLPTLPRPLRHSQSGPISSETHQQAAPPPLRRSTSEPITPERYQVQVAAADTPPEPPAAARTLSRCPTSDQDFRGEYGKESGEAVWIEHICGGGGGLIIHFKCPCGQGYQILLSGNTCYYKLM